jgi:GAF domain-containing protein
MIRTLILDDDGHAGTSLAHTLRRHAHPAFEATATTTLAEAERVILGAEQPFDLFLIDQHLSSDTNSIKAMQSLGRLNPGATAILLTSNGDRDIYLHAYQADDHRCLSRPVDIQELVQIIRSSHSSPDVYDERDWLWVLTTVAEEAQRALSVQQMVLIIVQGSVRLGFERARLWLASEDGMALVGAGQAGNTGLDRFVSFRMPISASLYTSVALQKREPSFFQGQTQGPGYLWQHFADQGFDSPVGEWAHMPLWAGERCLGMLTLDNASREQPLRRDQRRFLSLFGRQVAAALERARLFESEQRRSKEQAVLNQIGQRVTSRAALDDLDKLLYEVRTQIGTLMDVRNFKVVLLDEDAQQFDFRLQVENNRIRPRHWRPLKTGLVGHLISEGQALFLPKGCKDYRKAHGIGLFGRRSRCWLGAPLCVEGRAVGAIVVQSYDHEQVYTEEDLRLLNAVADRLAGAIQTAHMKERQAQISHQLHVLYRASTTMMKLADEGEDLLWHAALTAATAGYALSFNRAMVFLVEEGGTRLRGRLGIGHFDPGKARRDWRKDQRAHLDFDSYLQRLRGRRLRSTPVEEAVHGWVLDDISEGSAFALVIREGQRAIVPAAEAVRQLSSAFTEHFGMTAYALLPLRTGSGVAGVVVVDNIHDHKPLRNTTLDDLETLLTQVMLTLESMHQRRAREQLIDLNHTIMANVSNQPLKKTLTMVCRAAQAATGADCVLIYPLKYTIEPYECDIDHIGQVGLKTPLVPPYEISPKGVTSHILRSGTLSVPDVAHHSPRYDRQRLADHPFLRREDIRALIGTPVCDMRTGEVLGMLYLDYRMPRSFSEQDVRQAETFASLATIAIRNAWSAEQVRNNLRVAKAARRAREQELEILQRVLAEALAADAEEQKLIRTLLIAAQDLIGQPNVSVGILLPEWDWPGRSEQDPSMVRGKLFLNLDGQLLASIPLAIHEGAAGVAFQTGQTQIIEDMHQGMSHGPFDEDDAVSSRSEIDVPIKFGAQVIGIFNAQSLQVRAFTLTEAQALERLAAAAGLALDNVRRQQHLYNVLSAAQAVMAPTDLHQRLNTVLTAARSAAPGLSALTTWYRDHETGRIVAGPHDGVRDAEGMQREYPSENSVVWKVIHSPEPIWAPIAREEARLAQPEGRFIKTEGIESVAAFPLRADGAIVGALFFNYRQHHEFTGEERALFTILAEIAASSMRDAARLDAMHKERDRLKKTMAITEAVGTTLDLDQTLGKIMETLCSLFPTATPCVLIYNSEERVLEFAPASQAFYQIDNPIYQGLTTLPVDGQGTPSCLARRALETGKVDVMNDGDVTHNQVYLPLRLQSRSELCLTMMSGTNLLGILILESPKLNAFDNDDIALIRSVGHQVRIALERAYQSAQLRFNATVAATTAWAAEIAHDINREVSYIRNRAYWLQQEWGPFTKGWQYAREIDDSAAKLAGTLKNADSWDAAEREVRCLDEWLKCWISELIPESSPNIRVQYEPGCGDREILFHPVALQRVLRQLIRNSLNAMRGKGTLTVRTQLLADQRVEVQIEDTGSGVPDQIRPILFQQPVLAEGKDGGFGLMFVRSIVEEMGGSVRLLPSAPWQGAVFAVRLPIMSAHIDREE